MYDGLVCCISRPVNLVVQFLNALTIYSLILMPFQRWIESSEEQACKRQMPSSHLSDSEPSSSFPEKVVDHSLFHTFVHSFLIIMPFQCLIESSEEQASKTQMSSSHLSDSEPSSSSQEKVVNHSLTLATFILSFSRHSSV